MIRRSDRESAVLVEFLHVSSAVSNCLLLSRNSAAWLSPQEVVRRAPKESGRTVAFLLIQTRLRLLRGLIFLVLADQGCSNPTPEVLEILTEL